MTLYSLRSQIVISWREFFRGKRITVMGLGLLGRGVGDAAFLARLGARLTVTDLKPKRDLAPSLRRLAKYSKSIAYRLGGHRLSDFRNKDLILKAAGVPFDSPYVREARRYRVPVVMSTALFAKFSPAPTVGITGTRGKSTTTQLIFEILKKAYGKRRKIFLGGNTRGVATLPFLERIRREDVAVLELDSWQLQGFRDARVSPHVAVFTTFLPDHLNYYRGSMDRYLRDKAGIFAFQKPEDFLVLGEQAARTVLPRYRKHIRSRIIIARIQDIPRGWKLRLIGAHNRYNVAVALAVARCLGVPISIARSVIEKFPGVPGRLEYLRTCRGIRFYNDTTATTPAATLAALKSFPNAGKRVILIMGGSNKQLDMTELLRALPRHTKAVVLLPGAGTEAIRNKMKSRAGFAVIFVATLPEAVHATIRIARKGDIILFSPAFASFGMFKNEFDRGEKFCRIVKRL